MHVDGENLLTDPGRGLYSRAYFGPQRYENIFANSYGHSVPRIGGQPQLAGREFGGELLGVETTGEQKSVTVEFARAYPVEGLASLKRRLVLGAEGEQAGTIWLDDEFHFAEAPSEVEEAFITWLDVETNGATALLHGARHDLQLVIEAPEGASFELEELREQSEANAKNDVLKRLRFILPAATEAQARVRMEILPRGAT